MQLTDDELRTVDATWLRRDMHSQGNAVDRLPWFLLLACCATVVLSFRHTLLLMVSTWYRSRTYSHCFLILPIFLYLVWVRREQVASQKRVPNFWGLPTLLCLTFIWLLGNLAEIRVVQEFAVVSILVAVVWTILGTDVVRSLAFPLAFLFFAVPFGTSLIKPLQEFTAWFVIHALTISHVPAVMENHVISLPSGVWTVAAACSGIRFLLSSVVLGTVFAFLMYRSPKRRVIFLCASIIVPIIGNGLRAYGTILLAYITNNRLAAGVDHVVYGGFFVVLIQLLLIAVGLRWRERPEPIRHIAPDNQRIESRVESRIESKETNNNSSRTAVFAVALTAGALIVVAPLAAAHLWNKASTAAEWADPPVIVTAPWQVKMDGDTSWAPVWRGADKQFSQSYTSEANSVDFNWAFYSGRRETDLLDAPEAMANTKSWVVATDGFENATVDGRRIKIYRSLIESGVASRAVWTWYCLSGDCTASRAQVRYLQAKARLLGKSASVAIISLGADNQTNAWKAEGALQEFLLHACFPAMAGARSISQCSEAVAVSASLRP